MAELFHSKKCIHYLPSTCKICYRKKEWRANQIAIASRCFWMHNQVECIITRAVYACVFDWQPDWQAQSAVVSAGLFYTKLPMNWITRNKRCKISKNNKIEAKKRLPFIHKSMFRIELLDGIRCEPRMDENWDFRMTDRQFMLNPGKERSRSSEGWWIFLPIGLIWIRKEWPTGSQSKVG